MGKSNYEKSREGGNNANKGDKIGSTDDRMDGKGNLTKDSGKHQDANLTGPKTEKKGDA